MTQNDYALPPCNERLATQDIHELHNGGATQRSCYHRRKEAFDMRRILMRVQPDGSTLHATLGELAEAADAYARLNGGV